MRKPTLKMTVAIVAVLAVIVSVVAFAKLWPGSRQLQLSGEVEAREIKTASRFGGRVIKVMVKEGDKIEKGQLLVEFDDTELEAQIAEAKAALSQAESQEHLLARGADVSIVRQAGSQVQQAQQQYAKVAGGARPEDLTQATSKLRAAETQFQQAKEQAASAKVMLDEGIISKQKYDSMQQAAKVAQGNLDAAKAATTQVKQGARPEDRKIAQAQLNAAKAQYQQVAKGAAPEEVSIASANVEKAKSALTALVAQRDEYHIKSPFAGHVSVLSVTEGELVGPGRPVLTIIDYSSLWTDIYVPESQLSIITLGEPVAVTAKAAPGTEFKGQVALINPKSEFIPNTGGSTSSEEATFRVKVSVDPRDASGQIRIYPGMNVDVTFRK